MSFAPNTTSISDLKNAIERAGYDVLTTDLAQKEDQKVRHERELRWAATVASVLARAATPVRNAADGYSRRDGAARAILFRYLC